MTAAKIRSGLQLKQNAYKSEDKFRWQRKQPQLQPDEDGRLRLSAKRLGVGGRFVRAAFPLPLKRRSTVDR